MNLRHGRWLPWAGGLLALAAFLAYGPGSEPLFGDRAYLAYMGQVVGRGEPLYTATSFGYPPLAPLLSGVAIRLGSLAGIPSFFSPRILAGLCFVLTGVLVAQLGRRMALPFAGLGAVVVFAGLAVPARLAATGLEPKALAALATLATALAAARGRWLLAGISAGLGASSWHPAVALFGALLVLAPLLARRAPEDRADPGPASLRWRPVLAVALGGALGMLPAVLYLQATGSWRRLWLQAVVLKSARLASEVPFPGLDVLKRLLVSTASEVVFLGLAVLGACWLGWHLSRKRKPLGEVLPAPDGTGLVGWSLAWGLVLAFDCQGAADLLPVLPLLALWAGLGLAAA
ncbi:MAG: hypothetical protein KDD47_09110, partial [Acidobacteria bacterium]|nr:hypothetical protein [Acidobacteriota bacterium]